MSAKLASTEALLAECSKKELAYAKRVLRRMRAKREIPIKSAYGNVLRALIDLSAQEREHVRTVVLPSLLQPKPCYFLDKLSAELRNLVYEYALLDDTSTPVQISPTTFSQPPLLRVCKQTRAEASGIYYAQNTFVVEAALIDHSLAEAFVCQAGELASLLNGRLSIRPIVGSPAKMFENVFIWLEKYYHGEVAVGIAKTAIANAATAASTANYMEMKLGNLFAVAKSCSEIGVGWQTFLDHVFPPDLFGKAQYMLWCLENYPISDLTAAVSQGVEKGSGKAKPSSLVGQYLPASLSIAEEQHFSNGNLPN